MANKLIILFDNTNAITSHIDPSIGVFRQGDVGHEIYCHFVNFANYAYGAYIIFERADGSKSPELPMTLADFTYSGTLYSGFKLVIDDEWIMAQDGSLKATVRVRNASGTVVASGLIPISLEKTVYDESPDITVEQYNAFVAMLEGFITDDSILYPHVLTSIPEDLTDFLVNSVLFVITDIGTLLVYKVVASGEDKVLSDAFEIDSSFIKETFSPTNYTPTASTAKGHFVGIDNELGDIITGDQVVGRAVMDEAGHNIRESYGASLYTDNDDVALKIALRNKLNAVLTTLILREATTTKNGLMSSADKVKLEALPTNADLDIALAGKADKATTLSGYGITDAYTKTEADNLLDDKADLVDGKVPASQLPGFVDDVIMLRWTTIFDDNNPIPIDTLYYGYTKYALYRTHPSDPAGKVQIWIKGPGASTYVYERPADLSAIYVGENDNLTWRLPNENATQLTQISQSLALGETSQTAYRGDRGKTAYDHSQLVDGSNPHGTTFSSLASKPTTLSGFGITDAVPDTRTIIGIPLSNDISKSTFSNALCDDLLDDLSSNPVKNKSICSALGGEAKYYKTGDYSNNEAPNDYADRAVACGMTFNKADLKGKDISLIKTKVCFYNSSVTFPRTIEVRLYLTDFETAQGATGVVTLDAPIKTLEIVVPSNNYDITPYFSIKNSDITTDVFAIIFYDKTGGKGIYLAKSTRNGYLYNKNGGLYVSYGSTPNRFIFTGNEYGNYFNYYIEMKYIDLSIAFKEDIDNFIEKEEVGYQKQENRNIWNINEQVESSYANPANGNIENYPENQYIRGYIRSGYLKISPNTQYILSVYGNVSRDGYVFVCYYDEDKTFISGGQVNGSSSEPINGTVFTTPNNANIKYAIVSISDRETQPYQLEEGDEATSYQVYTGDKYEMKNLVIGSDQIEDVDTPESYINLPDELYAVVGDTFEMFYKGILNLKSYENMYVECVCNIGYSYQRKFVCTPVAENIGNNNLTIKVYNNNKVLVDSKIVTLKVVAKATSPVSNKNILCMGDSLTNGGQWVSELHRRINLSNSVVPNGDTAPTGLGLTNITFIGKRLTSNGAGFEGFGGWKFSNYLDPSTSTNDYWVTSTTHNKTEADQESIWKDANNVQWQLETIETNRLKFKKYSGAGVMPTSGTLTWVSGGTHTENIVYAGATLAEGNPFAYNGEIDFEAYCEDLGISTIDEVYIFLGWNNFSTAPETYKAQAKQFIDLLRAFNPDIKVVLMGLEVPSADGIAQNYGADASLTYLKQQKYVFDLNNLYQEIANEYDSGVSFMNVASQFDTDYCMPTIDTTPNTRVLTTIKQQSNGVHPSNVGYYQIADIVYRWINAKINN